MSLPRTEYAQRGWERARGLGQLVLSGWALLALSHAALQREDIEAAQGWQAQFLTLLEGSENLIMTNIGFAHAAEIAVAAGRLDEAERVACAGLAISGAAGSPYFAALARAVLGRIALARGDPATAAREIDAAIAVYEATGSNLELGRARLHRAAVHVAQNERDAARAAATLARDSLAGMSAVPDAARADAFLAELA